MPQVFIHTYLCILCASVAIFIKAIHAADGIQGRVLHAVGAAAAHDAPQQRKGEVGGLLACGGDDAR